MFPFNRSMRSILEIVILLGALLPVSVVAKPVPLPPSMIASDYSPSVNRLPYISKNLTAVQYNPPQSVGSTESPPSDNLEHARAVETINDLYRYYNAANTNAVLLNNLYAQAASSGNTADFQRNYAAALANFRDNFASFQTTFARIGAGNGKGLLNYDRTNDLETLLKNLINLNKQILEQVYLLINGIPVLGPILGPIVFQIKCIIDGLLDTVENITDAIINGLTPLLALLLGQSITTTCASGIVIVGLCI